MNVQRFHPSILLDPFIREYIVVESDVGTDSNILPDTSMVMAFRYKGNIQRKEGENAETLPSTVISGLRRSHRIMSYSGETANLLVVFKEGGLSAFSSIPANEFFDLNISSDNIFPAALLNDVLWRLSEAPDNKSRIEYIETFLLQHLTSHEPDILVGKAIQLIKQQNGIIKIKDLSLSL